MVVKSLLVRISLRVILPLVVILLVVFGPLYFGLESDENMGLVDDEALTENVEQVIARFMEAGAARNMGEAYACVYYRSEEGLAGLINRGYDDVFAGYRILTINSIWSEWRPESDWSIVVGDDEDGGDIDRCYVEGKITYTSGTVLPFDASMGKENDIWKIRRIRIGDRFLISGRYLS